MGFTMSLRCFHPPTPHPPSQSPKAQKIGEVLVGRSSPRPLIIIINNQSPLVTMNNHQSSIGCAHIGCGLANYLLNWSVKVHGVLRQALQCRFLEPHQRLLPQMVLFKGYSILSYRFPHQTIKNNPHLLMILGSHILRKLQIMHKKQTEKINCKKW